MNTPQNILIALTPPPSTSGQSQSPLMAFLPLLILIAIAFILFRRRAKKMLAKALEAASVSPTQNNDNPDIHFECPKCKQTLDAPKELAAQSIECPTCKEMIEVPIRSCRVVSAVCPPTQTPVARLLIKCPSCQSDVSTEAAACPKCGHQFKYAGGINLKDPIHQIGLVVCALFIIGVIFYIYSVNSNNHYSAINAQESERIKSFDNDMRSMRKSVEDLDKALHPKK